MKLKAATPTLIIRIIFGLIVVTGVYLFFIDRTFYWTENTAPLNRQVASAFKPSAQYLDANFTTPEIAREKVKLAFLHAWKGYSTYAYGKDEYHPLSKKGENLLKHGIGFTIVDSLDTIILMGLEDEYNRAKYWIENSLDFNQYGNVNVFETTIRVLGGLLSSYHLKKDPILLEKAVQLGDRLAKGFNTRSGIPIPTINLKSGAHSQESLASTAEATTLQLENKYLSHLTNNRTYWDLSQRVNDIVAKQKSLNGLVPIYLSVGTGEFSSDEIRLGSRGDSYYEYLLKQWLISSKTQPEFRALYDDSMTGVKKHLVGYTSKSNLTFIGEIFLKNPKNLSPKMDHLVCYLAGNLALGATEGVHISSVTLNDRAKEDLDLAERLAETCWYTYTMNPTGLSAEITFFQTQGDTDAYVKRTDSHSLLRPETIESLFILYRITGNEKYRAWGWKMFRAFEKYAKVETGFTNLGKVTQSEPEHQDKVETFFLVIYLFL